MWHNYNQMPLGLKFLTILAFASVGIGAMSFLPKVNFTLDGKSVTPEEWWSSGAAVFSIVISLIMPLTGVFLLKRASYARPIYLIALLVISQGGPIFIKTFTYSPNRVIMNLIPVIIIGVYFYFWKPAKKYFGFDEVSGVKQ